MSEITEVLLKQRKLLIDTFANELIVISEAYYRSRGISNSYFKKSNLIKSIRVFKSDKERATLDINDYITYLDKGRRPKSRKVPIQAIISWMKRAGIRGDNKVAYKIQNSIYSKGIKPRNFIDRSADKLFKEVVKVIDDHLNNQLKSL